MVYSYLDGVRASSTLEAPPRSQRVFRWVVGVLLVGHGLIHAMGPIAIWGGADIPGLSGQTTLAVSNTVLHMLAVAWIGAMVVLLAAGFGALAGRSWWKGVALAGAILSQLVIGVWWSDAATGTVVNVIIAVVVTIGDRLGLAPDREYV